MGRKVDVKSNQRRGKAVKELWLKRRIQQSKQETRKHINFLEWKKHGEIIKKERYKVIEHQYSVKKKELNVVLEELKKECSLRPPKLRGMINELNSIGLTDCSNKIKKGCTNSWMEKLKAATQKKVGDFRATFG